MAICSEIMYADCLYSIFGSLATFSDGLTDVDGLYLYTHAGML